MLFIIAHHFVVHANWNAEGAGMAAIQSISDLNKNTVFLQCFSAGGKWTCCVFALLTGYFTVTASIRYKRIAKLILQLCFYSWTIVALAGLLCPQTLSLQTVFKLVSIAVWELVLCVVHPF